jgi:hypothetical protein
MTTPTFKFTWVPNSTSVTTEDRPINELDQQPGYIDSHSIEGLVNLFSGSSEYKQLKQLLEKAEFKTSRKGKPQRYNQMPKMKRIAIRHLLSALAVQRKINFDHLIKIITNWDSRRPATINVIKLPNSDTCYITDGQHTVLAIALRAKLGLFPDVDPKDWLDIEVNCQVVETSDFSFAREHFLGINGEDKLPINPFETHKINTFGKRLDSPNKETQEKYELANRIQTELESWNLVPVHPNSPDRFKAGAVNHVNLLSKLDVADIRFFGKNHSTYWDQEPLDAMEMLPFQDLRRRLEKDGEDFDSAEHHQFMKDLNALVKEVAGGWAEFKNLTQQVYPLYYRQARNEDPSGVPKDASLVLLLQLYEKAGGNHLTQFKGMTSFVSRYTENNTNMFKQLNVAKRALFK